MKFAYLIMLHTNFEQAAKLLEVLDDARNDLYIHIDRKVKETEKCRMFLNSKVAKSKLYFTSQHNVTWGGQVKLMLNWNF